MIGWLWPHIGKEVLECLPAIADCDATTTPVFVAGMFGIGATLPQTGPGEIGRSDATVDGVTVAELSFLPQTAAGPHSWRPQVSAIDHALSAAVAPAEP